MSIKRLREIPTGSPPAGVLNTLVPSLGMRIGPACEAGLSAGMRRERDVSPQIIKKEERKLTYFRLCMPTFLHSSLCYYGN